MAKILTTKGSAAALEDLIRRAEKQIFLISFSFIISELFISKIKNACLKGIHVYIVYGKTINQEALSQLMGLQNLNIYFLKNLHAKIFANEVKCIIGSMNFSEYSEVHNTELGVLLSLDNDKIAFLDTIAHCNEIINDSKLKYSANIFSQVIPFVVSSKAYLDQDSTKTTKDNIVSEQPNASIRDEAMYVKLKHLDRYQFTITVLEHHYGKISIEPGYDEAFYINIFQYNMSIFINQERIDFIYNNNEKYKSKRSEMKKALISKLNSSWFNPNRLNVTADNLRDIENSINVVMGYTIKNLI